MQKIVYVLAVLVIGLGGYLYVGQRMADPNAAVGTAGIETRAIPSDPEVHETTENVNDVANMIRDQQPAYVNLLSMIANSENAKVDTLESAPDFALWNAMIAIGWAKSPGEEDVATDPPTRQTTFYLTERGRASLKAMLPPPKFERPEMPERMPVTDRASEDAPAPAPAEAAPATPVEQPNGG